MNNYINLMLGVILFQVNGVTKLYFDKVVFSNYTAQLDAERLLITGPNGLGKSTLFSLLAGLEPFQSGEIKLAGNMMPTSKLQRKVALASDKIVFPAFLTAKQVLALTSQYQQCSDVTPLIEKFGFKDFVETKVVNLSSGNLKKLQLINALMREVDVLLLDEPTAALEHKSQPILMDFIKQFTGQVIVTSHEPEPFINADFTLQALVND